MRKIVLPTPIFKSSRNGKVEGAQAGKPAKLLNAVIWYTADSCRRQGRIRGGQEKIVEKDIDKF